MASHAEITYPRERLLLARTVALKTSGTGQAPSYVLRTCAADQLACIEAVEEQQQQQQQVISPAAKSATSLWATEVQQPSLLSSEAVAEKGPPPPPMHAPTLPPSLQASMFTEYAELHQDDMMYREVVPVNGFPPLPVQSPTAVKLSLQASVPPPWETPESPAQPSPMSTVQLSLSASLPPPSPSLAPWDATMFPATPTSLLPPSMPPSLPPMLQSPTSASLPPFYAPSMPAVPSWDAWSANSGAEKISVTPTGDLGTTCMESAFKKRSKKSMGFVSPTTCAGSEIESSMSLSADETQLQSSGSETDLTASSGYEASSACATPSGGIRPDFAAFPPPGLEAELSSSPPMLQKAGYSCEKESAPRALFLDCLL